MESNREINAVLFNAKTYDRTFFENTAGSAGVDWRFHEFHLSAETAEIARGNCAVCGFVNDAIDSACLQKLQQAGVRLVALRCAGFNNVDLECAKTLGMAGELQRQFSRQNIHGAKTDNIDAPQKEISKPWY